MVLCSWLFAPGSLLPLLGSKGNHKVQSPKFKVKEMADRLEEIVAHKRIEIEQRKRFIQPRQMINLTEQKMQEDGGRVPGGSMKEALMNSET